MHDLPLTASLAVVARPAEENRLVRHLEGMASTTAKTTIFNRFSEDLC